jgi:hypothetical protein
MFKERRLRRRIAKRSRDTLLLLPSQVEPLEQYIAAGWVVQSSVPVSNGHMIRAHTPGRGRRRAAYRHEWLGVDGGSTRADDGDPA